MADQAHEWTDEQIEALQRKFRRVYGQAEREMREKLDTLMADYERSNNEWLARLKAGEATQDEYEAWLKQVAMDKSFVGGMADTLAQDALRADQLAMDYINDAIPQVYAENANRAAYEVERAIGYDTHTFDLYDQSTVRRLVANDDAMLLPEPRVSPSKDIAWNRQKFTGAITQSVLQGESIPNAAKRLRTVFRMDENSAVRAARTAITGAENAGRTDSYKRAKRIGIDLEQEWIATLDLRTRHSHRQLDGQHVPVGEKFKVDGIELEYPGDPSAPGEYVWNCRCTLVAWFPDIEQEDPERWSKLPEDMTYEDWKKGKSTPKNPETPSVPWYEYESHMTEANVRAAYDMGDLQLRDMPYDQRHALEVYTGYSYSYINSEKRRPGSTGGHYDDVIRDMDEALRAARTDRELYVVRGVGSMSPLKEVLSRPGNENARNDPSLLAGQVIFDNAYMSTTVDVETAEFFGGGSEGVLFHLRVPEGANAVFVESISRSPGEQELLFRAHQEIAITNVDVEYNQWNDELWHVYGEILVD